eukprot:jgi/Tetstr1/439424/TSEL_027858.t1
MSTCDGSSVLSRHAAVRSEICSGTCHGGSSPAAGEQTPAAAPPAAAAAATTAPTADGSASFPVSDKPERGASDTRTAEDIRRARARIELVKKNLRASWGSHATRRKSPYWGFFVDNSSQEAGDCEIVDGSSGGEEICCILCFGSKTNQLHPKFPREGPFCATVEELNAKTWAEPMAELTDRLGSKLFPKYELRYKGRGGNNMLNHHLQRCHAEELAAVHALLDDGNGGAEKRARPEPAGSSDARNVIKDAFKSSKKVKSDSKKARTFNTLLTMLFVFALLPFNLLDNPVFKALIWFLDLSVPIPSRHMMKEDLLPSMVKDLEAEVMKELQGVDGVALAFDLWMSLNELTPESAAEPCVPVSAHDGASSSGPLPVESTHSLPSHELCRDKVMDHLKLNKNGKFKCKEKARKAEVAKRSFVASMEGDEIRRAYLAENPNLMP